MRSHTKILPILWGLFHLSQGLSCKCTLKVMMHAPVTLRHGVITFDLHDTTVSFITLALLVL